MAIVLITCGVVLLVTCSAFFTYELRTYKQNAIEHISTVAQLIANNSTASLAFENEDDARAVLKSLKAEPHILEAVLFNKDGKLFVYYPENLSTNTFPEPPFRLGYEFVQSDLIHFQPVIEQDKKLGTLYLRSDMGAMNERLKLYSLIVLCVMVGTFVLAYFLSKVLQGQITRPLLALTDTARAVSERSDYSVRAAGTGNDELGVLTLAFNNMLEQIHSRDIALQEAQQKLQGHASELERRVSERTAKLSETVAELEAFSYSISHDMRAPLRAMQGYSSYVIENFGDKIGPEGMHFLNRISRAGGRLDNLVQDILTYSRVSKEHFELHPVDLDILVGDIVQQYPGFQSPEAQITVQTGLGVVLGHEASLTQVISNLLGNAIKFVKSGMKPKISIFSEVHGTEIWTKIEDEGIGIAAKDLHRIFRIFERVHPESTYEGTGIGLSIVRKAMERMGGVVEVESELGKGCIFTIKLKRA
ncbi:MAG: Phytochrome, two-component sensor histidine kinase [Verrucomicrobiales bacterium]|nr:Phytochrome, two-component sensor histidine kinase [Verrucomicrobiales bacterium]